ncbi:hypothetical protein DPMN_111547 [Dreissena polymorpha]|uniref:Uncharacterized protein n=1 Tax=Dreissena polymorpha TaxID=45954 RepID=A0A9D4QNX8_DREPO|nr:hypothetical protein DPMN_111547 [Dreissena polymorpha]
MLVFLAARPLVTAVYVFAVQSFISHVVHRIRTFPATEHDGHVVDNPQHAQWRNVLRAFPRAHHINHSVVRYVQTPLQ